MHREKMKISAISNGSRYFVSFRIVLDAKLGLVVRSRFHPIERSSD